jgi:error-prone DNA polymerase
VADYIELHARSAFSMLDGASSPHDLARQAANVGLEGLALTDLDDLGGAVQFAEACADHGVRPIFGGELTLAGGGPLVLLCESREGWTNLATLISIAREHTPRGRPGVSLDTLAAHAEGLVCLSGGRDGALDRAASKGPAAARALVGRLAELFPGRFYIEVQDHKLTEDVARIADRVALSRRQGLPWVVTGDVRHATAREKATHDVLLCLKHPRTLDEAGDLLFPNAARRITSPREVLTTFRDAPAGVLRTLEVAERCAFHVTRDLRPSLPRFPLPLGVQDGDALLEAFAREGFRRRYREPSSRHEAQLRHELDVIRRLGLAGYFLIVHDLVRFATHKGILVQGRGSAANSVVCYCLGITAIDPVGMDLLFERFLADGRGEAPDIDIDIAHRDREEVLQYVYERYGRHHAAMVCNVNTWRPKSAVRDAVRVLGLPVEVADELARQVDHGVPSDAAPGSAGSAAERLERGGFERAGLDPKSGRLRALLSIVRGLEGLPRHRSIHVGGFVLTGEPLRGVVPIEPAAMQGRTVIQWEKDDLDPVGLVKIDLLGLGMLTLLSDALALVKTHRGHEVDLAQLPEDDEATYAMIRRADTVGVFQIESRAQMSCLPRTAPERFYDLVIQVALIRPGPIQGEMVHPYMRRRRGEEPVSYLHPCLEPVLARTLGVPLFQEQGMKVAITAAGFTPAQADELRRAMSSKRSKHRMARLSLELLDGMAKNGIAPEVGERIVKQLAGFASYGFPESHAASFALLVYASSYLKRHHAPEFYAALLNAQPMGFYPVGSILADAKRHGVELRPPDVQRSGWNSTLEPCDQLEGREPLALRLGLRLVRGLGPRSKPALERAQGARPFASIEDFAARAALPARTLEAMARAGAFDSLAKDRRHALWEVLRIGKPPAGPLDVRGDDPGTPLLPGLTPAEATVADYTSLGGSAHHHPMEFLAARRDRAGIPTLAALHGLAPGPIRVVGLVNSRQRPGTANGFVFLSLEDETSMVNVIVRPAVFDRFRDVIIDYPVLYIEGRMEKQHDVVNVLADEIRPVRRVPGAGGAGSHDFH